MFVENLTNEQIVDALFELGYLDIYKDEMLVDLLNEKSDLINFLKKYLDDNEIKEIYNFCEER